MSFYQLNEKNGLTRQTLLIPALNFPVTLWRQQQKHTIQHSSINTYVISICYIDSWNSKSHYVDQSFPDI